jgi:hypothetical protein
MISFYLGLVKYSWGLQPGTWLLSLPAVGSRYFALESCDSVQAFNSHAYEEAQPFQLRASATGWRLACSLLLPRKKGPAFWLFSRPDSGNVLRNFGQ